MARQKIKNTSIPGLLLLCGGIVYFAGQIAAQNAMITPYSSLTHTVSELGSTTCAAFNEPLKENIVRACSPLHPLMNAAFILFGLGLFAGVLLNRMFWPKDWAASAGMLLLALAGVCLVVVGLAPGNQYPAAHGFAANLQFYAQNIGLLLLGASLARHYFLLGLFTVLAGAVGLGGYMVFMNLEYLTQGYGLWQRVAGYPLGVWSVITGTWLALVGLTNYQPKFVIKRAKKA